MTHLADPTEAREHVARLVAAFPDQALSRQHIARLAGVSPEVLRRPTRYMARESVERLLAVRPQHVRLMPPLLIRADATRETVQRLMRETHARPAAIGRVAGCSAVLLQNVLNGQAHVRYGTHLAVTPLTPEDVQHEALWADREPTALRLRALVANGWPLQVLETMTGCDARKVASPKAPSPVIRSGTARRVQYVYDRIGDEVGPSRRVMALARNRGWLPPIHFDDDMRLAVDRPSVEVVRAERARNAVCALALTVEGYTAVAIADRLGISERVVTRIRCKYGLRMQQVGDGEWEAVEGWPGQIAAIRAAARDVHIYSTLDTLDAPGLDYVGLADGLLAAVAA